MTNVTGAGVTLPQKGEFYVVASLQTLEPGDIVNRPILQGYVWRSNDMHWTGELQVEQGDLLSISYRNSFGTNPFTLLIRGKMRLA